MYATEDSIAIKRRVLNRKNKISVDGPVMIFGVIANVLHRLRPMAQVVTSAHLQSLTVISDL